MDNVVGLNGGSVPSFEPDPELVAGLEELLEMSRSGEIVSLAGVLLHRDECTSYRLVGSQSGRGMLGALHMLSAELIEILRA